ncbi:MAG TPA: SAM-dependent chlorinase/fluorinase [Candidatus Dormibacteraeota bacterium]
MTSAKRPIVTLTTDFGAGSPYVAAIKAAVLRQCPDAVLVDIAHTVPAFNLRAAAFMLWAGTRHFGPAVHLAVVDPGVGTERRALAVQLGESYFVAPDNGLLTMVLAESRPLVPTSVVLKRPEDASATFEGRDVFAPAAGALAAGHRLREMGEEAHGLARLRDSGPAVLWVDNFGNLVTSLRPPVMGVKVGPVTVARGVRTYGEARRGDLFFYTGSMGLVEIGVREGRADVLLQAGPGTAVAAV